MKRKFLTALIALSCVIACALGLVACDIGTVYEPESPNDNSTHTHNYKWVFLNDGMHEQRCEGGRQDCNEPFINRGKHDFTNGDCICGMHDLEYIHREEPDCENSGHYDYFFCENCDKYFGDHEGTIEIVLKDFEIFPQGHDFALEITVVQEPTCTENGIKGKQCSRCSAVTEETVIPALGHDLPSYSTNAAQHWRSCSRCDYSLRENHDESDECSVCHFVKNGTAGLEYELNDDKTEYTVTGIGHATASELVIPSLYKGLPVTKIALEAFAGCDFVTSATIPNGITAIGRSAFACPNLTVVKFNAANCKITNQVNGLMGECGEGFDFDITVYVGANVIVLPENFQQGFAPGQSVDTIYSTRIKEFVFAENSSCVRIEKSVIHELGYNTFTNIYIPKSVTSIDDHAFNISYAWKDKETDKTFGRKVESITVEEGNPYYYSEGNCLIERETGNILAGCNNSVIPNGVTGIKQHAFDGCDKLTSITMPDSLWNIGSQAFSHCISLTTVTLTSNVTFFNNSAFDYCDNMESIYVEEGNPAYSSQDGILYNKEKTEMIYIPAMYKGTVNISESVTRIDDHAYFYCENIESYYVEEGNPVFSSQDGILYNKEKTAFIIVPKALKGNITIAEGISSIGNWQFSYCVSIKSITVPIGVTSIENYAFFGCESLELIIFNGTKNQWSSIAKASHWNSGMRNYTIRCTDGEITNN